MRPFLLGVVATASLLGASLSVGAADAQPAQLTSGVYVASDAPTLQPAQFFFGGQNYCWYGGGWRGPGYYYCGYAWRQGLGWGGGDGWNGWHGGGNHGGNAGGYHGGARSSLRTSGGVHAGAGHSGAGHSGARHASGGHAGGTHHR